MMAAKMWRQISAVKRAALVLLLLYATVYGQSLWLASAHNHNHAAGHCCGFCHANPVPLLESAISASLAPVLPISWVSWCTNLDEAHEVLFTTSPSRAPPA